jgi:hypothetical protein
MQRSSGEKDRLGDKLHDVEAAREDQWARQRDAELLKKIRERPLKLHCPKCGMQLGACKFGPVVLQSCPKEHGAWVTVDQLNVWRETSLQAIIRRGLNDEPRKGTRLQIHNKGGVYEFLEKLRDRTHYHHTSDLAESAHGRPRGLQYMAWMTVA